jgi:hypothetical protein
MAWTFVGQGGVVEIATATSHTLTEPAGCAAGDLLVACFSTRIASTTAMTMPSGGEWSLYNHVLRNNIATNTSAQSTVVMAICLRGSSAPNLTFTHPTNVSVSQGVLLAYRGNVTSSLLNLQEQCGTAVTASGTTSVSTADCAINTSQADSLLVGLFAGGQEATVTNWNSTGMSAAAASNDATNPASDAWKRRTQVTTTSGTDTSISVYDAIKSSAGGTGTHSCTASLGASHALIIGGFKMASGGGGSTGQIKIWNGSSWVAKPMKVWGGASWSTKPVKYWNGSSWITTTY